MNTKSSKTVVKEEQPSDCWLSWCRLCAKRGLSPRENSSIHLKNESGKLNSELATSIGKYFWINIKADDSLSQSLCMECKQLITELVGFTEHVNKVQSLYCLLQNMRPTNEEETDKLCSQCGLIDEEWQHIIKPEPLKVHKPLLIDKNVQTDLKVEETELHEERNEIIKILQKADIMEEDEIRTELEGEHVYDYVINEDSEIEFVQSDVYLESANTVDKPNDNKSTTPEVNHEEDVEDSDLFKEFKYKADNEEDKQKGKNCDIISEEDEAEDEFQVCSQSEEKYDESMEANIEILEEYEDDYNNTSEHQINETKDQDNKLVKGKRGRPFGSKTHQLDSTYCYECKECKRSYKNPNIFRKHMLSIHNVVVDDLPDFKSISNTCTVCNKQFLTRSSLKLHLRHHLPPEEKFNIPCPYCERKFSQMGAMRQHVNGIHHQMKPFICDQCGRACKTMAALTEHQLVHTNECPYECEVCHKTFKNKARLKNHLDIHNQSLYKCADCGLELNTKRTLLQHRLVHTDVKRFKCEFCEAAFKRSKALKNHLILHSGLKPYKCKFCNKPFSNGSNCRAHKKRAHPKELAEEEANGIEPERVPMPKIEELKSAKGVLVEPRKIRRHAGGLPNKLRKLLASSEKCKQDDKSNDCGNDSEIYETYTELQYEICKSEVDETESMVDNPSEECEETVIYEIIDEI